MKINLGCGNDVRIGYMNIDRFQANQVPPETYKQGDISSLDWLTEDGTVEEMVALDCIEYLPYETIKPALANWCQKLIDGGVLKILVPDCFAVAKAFSQGQLSLDEYLQITFGSQNENDKRLSAIDAITLIDILQEIGMTVSLKRYDGIAIYIEVIK